MGKYCHVRLQTRKVQNYIFRFPKWRIIVGANSSLGELFAYDLPKLREDYKFKNCALTFPDPYGDFLFDNPQKNMKSGTICSAGGHYEGLFENNDDAIAFCQAAARLINRKLPGIQFGMAMKEFSDSTSYNEFDQIPFQSVDTSAVSEQFYGLPDLQISSDDGLNPVNNAGQSDLIELMNEQKSKFFKNQAKDFLCEFLKNTKIQYWAESNNNFDTSLLAELSKTRNKNQIAMIVIDGNKMGVRFREMILKLPKDIKALDAFIEIERFWLASRNNIRTAMKAVLQKVSKDQGKFPVWPIFLGGDDVMLLSTPERALDLVLDFIEELKKMDKEHTISAGIAIVKDSYPLAQAHELAESCLSSAKKEAYRKGESALDWHILADSRTTDIEDIRRRDYMLAYKSGTQNCIDVLSCRPCTFEKAVDLRKESKGILQKVDNEERGMNKYKALRTILRQGKPMAEYQMQQLAIDDQSLQFYQEKMGDTTIYLSKALDIIELSALYRTTVPRRIYAATID